MTNTSIRYIVSQVQRRIVDEDAIRWTLEDLMDYLNSAVKSTILMRPDANALSLEVLCVEGAKQETPEGINLLFNVVRNVGGNAILGPYPLSTLDNYNPNWINEEPKDATDTYLYDERSPRVFYLYPPVKSGTKVEIIGSFIPEPLSKINYDSGDYMPLPPVFDNAVIEYMVYLAFSQDNEFAANANKANLSLAAFHTLLGNKNQSDQMNATSYQRDKIKPL